MFTTDQLEHAKRGIKLNLGCGFDHRGGYLNVDSAVFHEPDLLADVRDLSALEDGSAGEILANDLLEHLPHRLTQETLAEWARVLMVGGVLKIRVPDLRGLSRLILSSSDTLAQADTVAGLVYGTQAYDGDFHQAGFTDLLMATQLADAGFVDIVIASRDDWMLDVIARRRDDRPNFALSLTDGFYGFEPGEQESPTLLSGSSPSLRLLSLTSKPATNYVLSGTAEALVGDRASIEFEQIGASAKSYSTDHATVEFSIEGSVPPGVTTIGIRSDTKEFLKSDPLDLRSLHLRWGNLKFMEDFGLDLS